MEAFLFGVAGILFAIGVFGLGFLCGWRVRPLMDTPRAAGNNTVSRAAVDDTPRAAGNDTAPRAAPPLSDEEAAFQRLQNYTALDAYGLSTDT